MALVQQTYECYFYNATLLCTCFKTKIKFILAASPMSWYMRPPHTIDPPFLQRAFYFNTEISKLSVTKTRQSPLTVSTQCSSLYRNRSSCFFGAAQDGRSRNTPIVLKKIHRENRLSHIHNDTLHTFMSKRQANCRSHRCIYPGTFYFAYQPVT